MARKATAIPLLALLLILCLSVASAQAEEPAYAAYMGTGKRIAVQAGDVYGDVARNILGASEAPEYASAADMLEELRMGRVDAALLSHDFVGQLQQSGMYTDFDYLWLPEDVYVNKAGPVFHSGELRDAYNAWFAGIAADGTWQEVVDRWIGGPLPAQEDIPVIELTGENGVLRACDTGNYPPLIYYDENGEPAGFDIEMTSRFAQHMGMSLEVTMMSYEGIIPHVVSGKSDMSACTVTITDERTEGVLFGEPSVITQAVLIVPKSGESPAGGGAGALNYKDFAGKTIGLPTGYIFDVIIGDELGGTPAFYSETSAGVEDVRQGRIAGFMTDLSIAGVICNQPGNENFVAVPIPSEVFSGPLGAVSSDQSIIDRFNAFLEVIRADGTLAEMQGRWIEDDPGSDPPMPEIPLTGENGTLRAAIGDGSLPFCYIGEDGEIKGYCAELILRFAAHEGMDVAFANMEFSAIIPYIVSGKADIGVDAITITEERKKSVLFTDSVYDDHAGIIALKPEGGAAGAARQYTDLKGTKVGGTTGGAWEAAVEDIGAVPAYYSEDSAALEDVRAGRLEGYITDLSAARVIAALSDDLENIEIPKEFFSAPMGAIATDQALIDSFNAFLAEAEADGTLADMQSRWLDTVPDLDSPMPEIPNEGTAGTLKVATSGIMLPFAYMGEDNTLKGHAIELALRFGAYMNMKIEFADMDFGALIPYVMSGKAELSISCMSITEERKQSVLFSEPYYYDQWGVLVLADTGAAKALDYQDFISKRFAIKTGSIYDEISREDMKASETMLFEDYTSIYEAVLKGKVDAGMRGYYAAYVSLFEPAYDELAITPLPEEMQNNPIGAISMDQEVIDNFNAFLAEIKADGTHADMKARWLDAFTPEDIPEMPDIPLTGENGTLKVAISSDYMPFSFLGGEGIHLGFDIELATRFAAYCGKDIEFTDMAFSGLLPYVISGKADIAVSDITITEERKKSVLFTDSYFTDLSAIIYRKDFGTQTAVSERQSFGEWLQTGIQRNLLTDNRWRLILDGLGVTMIISVLAQLLGTVFGCFLCWLLMRKNRLARILGELYSWLIHGIPIVVVLMITYYIIFTDPNISNILVAVAAFTMVTGAGVALTLKGAIETVDPAEIEAARSIGFSSFRAFLTVTLPQAVRRALPSYTNSFVELVKGTAIVGYIAIQDLTRAADIIRSRTYDAYFPLLFVALIYLVVTTICVWIFRLIVKRINRGGVAE